MASGNLSHFQRRIDEIEILIVEAEGRMNQMVQLEPDDKGRREHDDSNDVLQDDEHLAKDHLRTEAEIALHNVNGLIAGNMPRGQDARNDAGQQNKTETDADSAWIGIFHQVNFTLEQRCCIFSKTESQCQANYERHRNHQRRFGNQFQRYLMLTAAEQATRSHFLGTETRVGNRQIDIIAQSEKEDRQYGCQQDGEPRLIALQHAKTRVLGCKHDICERCHGDVVIVGPEIVMFQMIFHRLYLVIERRTRPQHKEALAGSAPSVCIDMVLQRIAHHLGKAVHARDNLSLVGQNGAVEIFDDGADGINQRTIQGVLVINAHILLTYNLKRLTNGILLSEEPLSQSLCYDALVRRIERRLAIAFHQLEIEEVEECRIGQHDDAILTVSSLDHPLIVFDFSILTHHAAGLLHFRAHILNLTGCLWPDEEQFLIAYQIDAVGILVPRIDAVLPPSIIAQQDDKHERNGQSKHINERV